MTLRAGLVGIGMMGRHHARVLDQLDGVELVAVCDPSDAVPAHLSGAPVVRSISELVKIGVDYCVVAAPTGLHHELSLELAEHDIHCLIEKPLATTSAQGRDIEQAFAKRGLVGGVGHIERYNPALIELRQRLVAGQLGTLYQIATRRQGPFPGRIGDVGVVKDLATHDIDLTMWISNSDFTSMNAVQSLRAGRAYEDMVIGIGHLSNGAITSHIINWLTPFKERCTIVHGEHGVFLADTLTADLSFFENGSVTNDWDQMSAFKGVSEGNVTRYALQRREPLLVEHQSFRDAVRNGDDGAIVTLPEGRRVLEIAEKMLENRSDGN